MRSELEDNVLYRCDGKRNYREEAGKGRLQNKEILREKQGKERYDRARGYYMIKEWRGVRRG